MAAVITLLLVASLAIAGPAAAAIPADPVGEPAAVRIVSLSELLAEAQRGAVATATIDDRQRRVTGTLRRGGSLTAAYPPGFAPDLTARLPAAGVDVRAADAGGSGLLSRSNIVGFVLIAALLLLLVFVGRNRRITDRGSHAASPARFSKGPGRGSGGPGHPVQRRGGRRRGGRGPARAGRVPARPGAVRSRGRELPNGHLLVGPPGTGKTLLARAVAGEAGVPFYAMSGWEFVETYVGVGASRMRALFERARGARKAIVFIDELDAIGKTRSAGPSSGANDERETT